MVFSLSKHSVNDTFAENNVTKHKKRNFRNISDLLQNSALYPVSQVGNVKSSYRKIWWTIVLFIGLIGSGYQITLFLLRYFEYPIVVDVKLESPITLDFPAVTICNLNRMKKKFLSCIESNISLTECQEEKNKQGNKQGGPLSSSFQPAITFSERRKFSAGSNNLSDSQKDVAKFLIKYMILNYETRKAAGYDYSTMVIDCSFKGLKCNENYFYYFQSQVYGNCFTFNKKTDDKNVFQVSAANQINGLDLVLELEPDSYLQHTSALGARVVVHDPDEDPNPEESGINVSPGFQTAIKIEQTFIKRLPNPYPDQCLDYKNDTTARGRNRNDCVKICIQEQNLKNCSCVDPTVPALSNESQCDMLNETESTCLDRVLVYLAINGIPCKCPPMCERLIYMVKSDRAKWPSLLYKCMSCEKNKPLNPHTQANIQVLYPSFRRLTLEESPMYQYSQLFSNLGSLLNLWLGFSLFVIFEIVEKIVLLCQHCNKRNM